MRILNIMLGTGQGGLEQVALDYHLSLNQQGHKVTSVFDPASWAMTQAKIFGESIVALKNMGEWDPLAALKLRSLARAHKSDLVICHGNRAIRIALKFIKGAIPIVAVAHNYKNKSFNKCDAVFCITESLMSHIKLLGFSESRLFHVPNMIPATSIKGREPIGQIYRIGALGRLVEIKGIDIFLDAIAIARATCDFRVFIGGDGPLESALKKQCHDLELDDIVTFKGWIKNKELFFDSIDLLVLPSRSEAFGLVLIEAMAKGIPCISLPSEGPSEIISHEVNGILAPSHSPDDLSMAIVDLLQNTLMAQSIATAGLELVSQKYADVHVSKTLDQALSRIIAKESRDQQDQ